jgi:hypothetical protein
MFCPPPRLELPAFNCAVLLRTLPLAAIQFKDRPSTVAEARAMVAQAEGFLTDAKESGIPGQARDDEKK